MEISVQEKKENPLLKRTEVRFTVEFDGATPSRKDVREKLCGVLKSSQDLTVIGEMMQGFGQTQLRGYAKVYKDAEAIKVEMKHILRREKGEKVKKGGAKKASKPAEKKA